MKITFFISSLSGGGAERVVCNLSNYLVKNGHDITVLTVGKTNNEYNLDERVKVISLEGKNRIRFYPLRVLVKMLRLKKYLKESDADLTAVFLPRSIKSVFHYKKYIKTPVVVTESVDPHIYDDKKIRWLLKCFTLADGAVFLTEEAEKFYKDKITLKSSIVIPNAVNPEFLKPRFNGERRKAIVAVGRHTEQKNFPLLINAFSEIVKDYPEYTLEIYGKGKLTEDYKKQCEELGIADKVIFPGFCQNIQDKIYDAGAFVLSSDFEGIPVALIEAMALGVPCISTDCGGGGARFLIKDGINGILVPVKDKNKLAEAIKKVLSDASFAEKLSENAAKISQTLSGENIYPMWEKYFSGIVKNEV